MGLLRPVVVLGSVICGVLSGASCGALAQNQRPQSVPPSSGNESPAPEQPGKPAPQLPDNGSKAPSGSSSEELSRSGGVIRPPSAVDPRMNQSTPDPGSRSMPVLPPPGTPGGNPSVTPK